MTKGEVGGTEKMLEAMEEYCVKYSDGETLKSEG